MCMYCERKTKIGWDQPALCDENWEHFSSVTPDQITSNLTVGEEPTWEARIHDYKTSSPELVLKSKILGEAFWGGGAAMIYVPIKFCPVCGRKLGEANKEDAGKKPSEESI